MRAVYYEHPGQTPWIADRAAPEAPAGGVVIDVEATGLCRSDWHAWIGHDTSVTTPHVPGHELVGTIASVGAGVSRWRPGQRVTTPFVCGCGVCEQCLAGSSQVCPQQTQPGFTHFGSWAQQVVIHAADHNLVEVPADLPAEGLVSLGCRFATAFRGLHARAKLQPGELLAVIGCGGVGLSAVMVAKALRARIVAVDVNDGALDLAREFGAEFVVNSTGMSPEQVAEAIAEAAGEAPCVTVEALGRADTMNAALLALAPLGRHVQIGLFEELPATALPRVIALELSVFGSHGMAARDYPELLELVVSGALRPDALVTRTLSLEEVPAALEEMTVRTPPGITLIRP